MPSTGEAKAGLSSRTSTRRTTKGARDRRIEERVCLGKKTVAHYDGGPWFTTQERNEGNAAGRTKLFYGRNRNGREVWRCRTTITREKPLYWTRVVTRNADVFALDDSELGYSDQVEIPVICNPSNNLFDGSPLCIVPEFPRWSKMQRRPSRSGSTHERPRVFAK